MPLAKGHHDDQWMPFTKPTDPCQVAGCPYEKHIFPRSEAAARAMNAGHQDVLASVRQNELAVHDLQAVNGLIIDVSRWCTKHTIERGFCLLCHKQQIQSRQVPFCPDCIRYVQTTAKQVFNHDVSMVDYTQEILSRNRTAKYSLRH